MKPFKWTVCFFFPSLSRVSLSSPGSGLCCTVNLNFQCILWLKGIWISYYILKFCDCFIFIWFIYFAIKCRLLRFSQFSSLSPKSQIKNLAWKNLTSVQHSKVCVQILTVIHNNLKNLAEQEQIRNLKKSIYFELSVVGFLAHFAHIFSPVQLKMVNIEKSLSMSRFSLISSCYTG